MGGKGWSLRLRYLVVVLRPRYAGVICSEKSPICPAIILFRYSFCETPDFRGRGRRRARAGVPNFGSVEAPLS